MKNKVIKSISLALIIATAITGCTPDEVKGGNPLTQGDPDASFTASTADGNHYTATATSTDADIQYHTWKMITPDPNDVETEAKGGLTKDFTFLTPGTYKIQHRAVGLVAGINSVSEQTFIVTTSALGPNIVASPNFENPSDWSVANTSGTQTVTWTFNSGSATANGGVLNVWTGQVLYQAVQVQAGTYRLDMHVESPGASENTWFHAFLKSAQPVNGSDYGTDPETVIGLNTWAGCALAPFNGMLSSVGCVGTGQDFTFATAGTYYIAIKAGTGANNGVNQITISDVSLRKVG
jgi:hypothetical protein